MATYILRTFFLQITFTFFSLSAMSQGIFDEKFDNCNGGVPCFYCGDSVAHYTKDLNGYFAWNINHSYNNSRYVLKSFDVMYEVFVDSAGHACVISIKSIGVGWSWLLKDDIRKWINTMRDWKPAIKNGSPINSSVVIECNFRENFLWSKYVQPPAPFYGYLLIMKMCVFLQEIVKLLMSHACTKKQ